MPVSSLTRTLLSQRLSTGCSKSGMLQASSLLSLLVALEPYVDISQD